MNSVSNFPYTLTDTRYVLLERRDQRHNLSFTLMMLVMYCWEDMNSVSNLFYTLTDTRYVLLV